MTRLDRHVIAVQNKLTLHRLFETLLWMVLGYAIVVCAAVIAYKLFGCRLPHQNIYAYVLGAAAATGAMVLAIVRRPGKQQTAVAIDQRLALKEKFSTALAIRASDDPFARAAVLDAEQTALALRLGKQFPMVFPRVGYAALGAIVAAWLCTLLPMVDLLGHAEEQSLVKQQDHATAVAQAHKEIQEAIDRVEAMPLAIAKTEDIQNIAKLLENVKAQRNLDPAAAHRTAVQALQEVSNALAEAAERDRRLIAKQNQDFHDAMSGIDDKGPLAGVVNDLKKGDPEDAAVDLEKVIKTFESLKPQEQAAAATQMSQIANQLEQMANDPKTLQKAQQQLQNMGMTQQQAASMVQNMQQAANGNQQAAQQVAQAVAAAQANLQQQIQAAQQQANAGNAQAQQLAAQLQAQAAALNQAIAAAQAQANAQAQAGAMAQGAQQMAQAMRQQAGAQGGNQQAMAQGAQAMQNALNQVQALRQDAAAVAAQQQAAQQAVNNACNAGGPGGNTPGDKSGNNQGGASPWQAGDPVQAEQGEGQGGPGVGNGGNGQKTAAPSAFVPSVDTSPEDQEGKVLAGSYVKDRSVVGESKAAVAKIAAAKLSEPTDEVETSRVSGSARKAAEEYFRTMANDNKK